MAFTAWLTTDRSATATDACDVVVLKDDSTDPEDWEQFHAITTVDARTGDHDDAIKQARDLLEDAGWHMVGKWNAVPTGYVITVER